VYAVIRRVRNLVSIPARASSSADLGLDVLILIVVVLRSLQLPVAHEASKHAGDVGLLDLRREVCLRVRDDITDRPLVPDEERFVVHPRERGARSKPSTWTLRAAGFVTGFRRCLLPLPAGRSRTALRSGTCSRVPFLVLLIALIAAALIGL